MQLIKGSLFNSLCKVLYFCGNQAIEHFADSWTRECGQTIRAMDTQEGEKQLQKTAKDQRAASRTAIFYLRPCFVPYNNQLMHSKASLAVILIAMLLTQSLHGLRWQGTGSGMNHTVIAEIWDGLEGNLEMSLSQYGRNNLVNGISNRLNTLWGKAWNVVLSYGRSDSDTILYGYAFNNQWMWYNGVPYASQDQVNMATLIVWKDYNCQDWKNIAGMGQQASSFTTDQKNAIKAEIDKMTLEKLTNDVWGTAFTMMDNLGRNALFSSGAYSVIMCQHIFFLYGRICRVSDGFYDTYTELNLDQIFPNSFKGSFYLFQTR